MQQQHSRPAPSQRGDGWTEHIRALLSPGYVERLRARDPDELLRVNGWGSGLTVAIGTVLTTAVHIDEPESWSWSWSWRDHLAGYGGGLALTLVAVTAFVALRSCTVLRPMMALRIHALLLLGVGVELAVYLTWVALFAVRPLHNFKWIPLVSPSLTTYAVALVAATWTTRRARYLTSVVGSLAFAWDLFLLADVLIYP